MKPDKFETESGAKYEPTERGQHQQQQQQQQEEQEQQQQQ